MTNSEAIARLKCRFPELDIEWAGGACPFQAEGILHGLPLYFRFRHSWADLRIDSGDWYQPLYSAGTAFGAGKDLGWLDPHEFVKLMTRLIPRLERAPIYWRFPGVEPGQLKAGEPATFGAWAHTPEQAWVAMHQPSKWLRDRGIDDATQAQWVAARKMSPDTITVDTRVFPDPDPFVKEKS